MAALAQEGSYNGSDLSQESLMARKDFVTVVKLFRDVLYELGRLRLIVNRVTLEPHLASKLREVEANQSHSDILAGTLPISSDKSGPAALLAPLSRLFYGTEGQQTTPPHNARAPPNRVKPASRAAASSALAAATVNIEFGGQGGIRRQVSIMPQSGDGGLAGKYNSLGKGSAPGIKPAKRDLSSIFAGGGGSNAGLGGDPWVPLPRNPSQRHNANTAAPNSRQRVYQPYSKNVDAVVDSVAEEDDLRPNLLERTLRPRGLSDSSIHSTFLAHANPSGRLLSPAGLALSAATDTASSRDITFAQGDATVKASLAASSSRPSILRAISGTGRVPAAKTTSKSRDSPSRADSSPATYARQSESDLLSPTKRHDARSRIKSTDGADSESGNSDKGLTAGLTRNIPINGASGLFANIGAWAARAGSGLSGSYVESSSGSNFMAGNATSGTERRPTMRSSSTTAARKPVHREPDL